MRLIKAFDTTSNFNNVIIPLSVDIDEVVFVYNKSIDERSKNNCLKIINRYKDIKVTYKKVNKEELSELIDDGCLIDIGTRRYLSIVLSELAIKNNLEIIYLDEEEQLIKSYNKHTVFAKAINLDITDLITLANGKIISHLHETVKEKDTVLKIKELVENIDDYSEFIVFINKVNSIISKADYRYETYLLKDEDLKELKNPLWTKYLKYNLFKIEENRLSFMNKEMMGLFKVSGAILENYIFHLLKDSEYFDDILMSANIEFNNPKWKYPIKCELDGLFLKENHLIFTSIKSNKVDVDALNEIKVHNVMFGNYLSKPLICTNSDLSKNHPLVYAKGEELGVMIIDKTDFSNKRIVEKIKTILDDTFEYEKI